MLQGRDDAALRREVVELFEQTGDLIGLSLAYNILSQMAYYRGDWDEAAAAYERAADLRRRVGDEVAAAVAGGNLGELLSDQGHFERARGLLEECRAVCAAAGFVSSRLFATMTLGRLAARLGRYDEAAAQLSEALAGFESVNMSFFIFEAQRFMGELALFRGDLVRAHEIADLLEGAAQLGSASIRLAGQRLRLAALVADGQVTAAQPIAQLLLDSVETDAYDYDSALTLVAASRALYLGGSPRADAASTRATAILARLGVVVPGEHLVWGPPTSP
jgi:tetratricopeptide (TPR) repeat protein